MRLNLVVPVVKNDRCRYVTNMLTCCALLIGGFIDLSAWAVYAVDVAMHVIMSYCWRSIIAMRGCSSNSIIPIQSTCLKYSDSLDFVVYLSGHVFKILYYQQVSVMPYSPVIDLIYSRSPIII